MALPMAPRLNDWSSRLRVIMLQTTWADGPAIPLPPRFAMPSTTAPSLLAAARDGSSEGWQRMVHLYGPLIYGWCRRVGRQPADAADATQDVLISVSRDLHRFDPQIPGATFRGWLWTITNRRLADQARRHARRMDHPAGSAVDRLLNDAADAVGSDPPTDAHQDRAAVVARAVALLRDQFEPPTWQAFWATVVEGREPAEVADSLGVSRWAIYKSRARVLHRLRQELEGLI